MLTINSRRRLVDDLYGHPDKKRRSAHLEDRLEDVPDPEDLAQSIINDMSLGRIRITEKTLERHVCRIWKAEKRVPAGAQNRAFEKRLSHLSGLFHFSVEEIRIICLLHCYKQSGAFESLCDSYNLSNFLKFISVAADLSLAQVGRLLGRKGRLIQTGMVEPRAHCPCYVLNDDIVEYMAGISDVPIVEKYLRRDDEPKYDLSSFSVPEERINILRALLSSDKGCNVLLYGDPGTGKTEFARSAASRSGKEVVFLQHGDDGDVSDRRLALQVAINTVPPNEGVLIVDEADSMLNTGYMFLTSRRTMEKGWLNEFLDHSTAKIIWIGKDHLDYK